VLIIIKGEITMKSKKLMSGWGKIVCGVFAIGMISSVGYAAEQVEVIKVAEPEVIKIEQVEVQVVEKTEVKKVEKQVWYESYDKALAESKKTNKPVFAFFTGSDWCGWCIRLHKEVLDKPAFLDWAKTKVVFLKVDFPRHGDLSAAQKSANAQLSAKFKIQGFPTVILLNSDGTEFARTGYRRGGEKGYITYLDQLLLKGMKTQAVEEIK